MVYHVSHNLRDQDSPKINPKELEQVDVLEEKEHQIILYNDDAKDSSDDEFISNDRQ